MSEPTNDERLATLAVINEVGISPGNALNELTDDVRAFHILFGQPAPLKPEMQPRELVERRYAWIVSEADELREAQTLKDQADAYLDIIYFAVGGLVELGFRFTHRLWRIVQKANLNKVWPDGSVRKNEAGKVIKPDGWVSPDAEMEAEIHAQINGTAKEATAQSATLNSVGNVAIEQLSMAFGGHVNLLMFAINEDGYVASTSNMGIGDQRDFLRYITQSLATGAVMVEHEKGTIQ